MIIKFVLLSCSSALKNNLRFKDDKRTELLWI